jgi:hypothetical protein
MRWSASRQELRLQDVFTHPRPVRDLRLVGTSPGFRSPMYPYVALDTTNIHTPITLGIRHRAKPLVFELRRRRPCGFDSHRPLHSQATPGQAGLQDSGQHVDPVGESWECALIRALPRFLTYPTIAPVFTRTVTRGEFEKYSV